jgi:hypothetical protein
MKAVNRIAQTLAGMSRDLARPEPSALSIPASLVGRKDSSETSVIVIPIDHELTPAGAPVEGALSEISDQGIVLQLDGLPSPLTPSLILGVNTATDATHYAALEILATFPGNGGRVVVHGLFGGPADRLLQPRSLTPRFDFESMTFALGLPAEVLHQWEALGVVRPVALDRLLLCPRCHGLPTFRHGCGRCGSGRVVKTANDLALLAVGAQRDPSADRPPLDCSTYLCEDCRWSGAELVGVHQCLHCAHRFSPQQAYEMVLLGYHADRLQLATA